MNNSLIISAKEEDTLHWFFIGWSLNIFGRINNLEKKTLTLSNIERDTCNSKFLT